MKVYTRAGDRGETSLFGGGRVSKDAVRVEAYGAVDELNAVLGVARGGLAHDDLDGKLASIQSALFDLGGELARTDEAGRDAKRRGPVVGDAEVAELESWIDELDTELEPLRNFILPGGAAAAAHLHHARTVCRRAERRLVTLARDEAVSPVLLRYLNRLSDLLFTLARAANRRAGIAEPVWIGRER